MLQAAAAESDKPAELQPLGDYSPPSTPTPDLVKGWVDRFKALLRRNEEPPFVADDELRAATPKRLDEEAPPPTCEPLLGQLDASLGEWADGGESVLRLRLVVSPPCDEQELLQEWARRHGLSPLAEPPRDELLAGDAGTEPDLDGDDTLVIPDLSRWFLRHRCGLVQVRRLMEHLATLDRRVLVGCNAWAWAFLSKAIDANAILPKPQTFHALNGERMQRWFADVGVQDAEAFRLSKTGKTLDFGDPENKDKAHFYETLAAGSRGVPWVAWQMWRGMLRTKAQAEKSGDGDAPAESDDDGDDTLWVSTPEPLTVPTRHEPDELLTLQTLLIHGPLTLREIDATVPTMNVSAIVQSLKLAGTVGRSNGGAVRVRPAAYGAIRTSLSDAGFPMGEV